ncbi:hypothetical protein PI125_g22247 [Phytophthora idaei]|nr:hypothetical protein PI125_g22247 [Phytophthora idaei]
MSADVFTRYWLHRGSSSYEYSRDCPKGRSDEHEGSLYSMRRSVEVESELRAGSEVSCVEQLLWTRLQATVWLGEPNDRESKIG